MMGLPMSYESGVLLSMLILLAGAGVFAYLATRTNHKNNTKD